ncbi:MAG: 30S ribosomal protein S4 [Candidatus Nanohaloarchaea archaeon]
MVKKLKKQYETPNEGWSEDRIRKEQQLVEEYGLKSKKEVYKAESELRSLRREARKLVAESDETQKEDLIKKANALGLVKSDAALEDILTLNVTDILDRRLQTAVNRRGFSDTANEARQLVVHGHVYVDGERVNIPSYILTRDEEKEIELRMPEPEETEEAPEAEETEEQEVEEETAEESSDEESEEEEE